MSAHGHPLFVPKETRWCTEQKHMHEQRFEIDSNVALFRDTCASGGHTVKRLKLDSNGAEPLLKTKKKKLKGKMILMQ